MSSSFFRKNLFLLICLFLTNGFYTQKDPEPFIIDKKGNKTYFDEITRTGKRTFVAYDRSKEVQINADQVKAIFYNVNNDGDFLLAPNWLVGKETNFSNEFKFKKLNNGTIRKHHCVGSLFLLYYSPQLSIYFGEVSDHLENTPDGSALTDSQFGYSVGLQLILVENDTTTAIGFIIPKKKRELGLAYLKEKTQDLPDFEDVYKKFEKAFSKSVNTEYEEQLAEAIMALRQYYIDPRHYIEFDLSEEEKIKLRRE